MTSMDTILLIELAMIFISGLVMSGLAVILGINCLKKPTSNSNELSMKCLDVVAEGQKLLALRQMALNDPIVGRISASGLGQGFATPEGVPPVWNGSQATSDEPRDDTPREPDSLEEQLALMAGRASSSTNDPMIGAL